jgi:hypothetical protein
MGHLDPTRITTQLVSLDLLTKHTRVRCEKEKKAKPRKQEQQRNTNDPFTSSNALELNRSLELYLWSEVYCSIIECNVLNAWMVGVEVVGVFIALNHQNNHWGWLMSMGAPDSPVRQTRHPTVRVRAQTTVGALSSSGTGQALFTDQCASSGCSDFCALSAHCSVRMCPLQSTVALVAVAPLGAPDSPVAHRTVH